MNEHLLSELEVFKNELIKEGATAELSMDRDGLPALLVFFEGIGRVVLSLMEGDDKDFLCLTAETTKGDKAAPEDIQAVSLLTPLPDKQGRAGTIKRYAKLLLSGKTLEVYPLPEMVQDLDEDENAPEAAVRLLPKTNMLADILTRAGAEDLAVDIANIPYILVVDGDMTFVAAYENLYGDEYLLHFRADIPYEKADKKKALELSEEFNRDHSYTRSFIGMDDLGIIDDGDSPVITFHACTIDSGDNIDGRVFGDMAAAFEREVMEFLEEFFGAE
ncbi:hypothetical protein NXH67_04420 [Butyrivibrio sp. DSM 10294]|uniref:hypothetical protein n=1 Tax=Butyrivibrio sp. DSM 10294 TaxID=2972457 RepID=UPI00234EE4A1|nr:hypothetical protein [Butyrivibrio sp. DSM 10294]MDC7292757.1 hypothetical protein [Butyrivibrio sp. DSM 10294]